jgi:hypothetical protein
MVSKEVFPVAAHGFCEKHSERPSTYFVPLSIDYHGFKKETRQYQNCVGSYIYIVYSVPERTKDLACLCPPFRRKALHTDSTMS